MAGEQANILHATVKTKKFGRSGHANGRYRGAGWPIAFHAA